MAVDGESSGLAAASQRWRRWLLPLLVLGAFALVLFVLDRELQTYHLRDVLDALHAVPASALWTAIGLTALSYGSLTIYDVLALRYVGKPLPYPRVATTSFIAYAFAHNFSLAALTGAAVRYRLYAPLGLTAIDVARLAAFTSVTAGLGICVLGSVSLLAAPESTGAALRLHPAWALLLGAGILALVITYVVWSSIGRRSVELGSWKIEPPGRGLVFLQVLIGVADLALSAAALWVLLPAGGSPGFVSFCGVYAAAILLGLISHVPGGLGVFESVLLLGIPDGDRAAMLAALLAYRGIYYLLPLFCGAMLFAGNELAAQGRRIVRALALVQQVAPQLVGSLVFLCGAVLLISGATPGIDSRIDTLEEVLPLALLESSHLAGSVIGLALLVLARSLFQRVNAAYHLTLGLLIAGILASLLKGLDFEEAVILAIVLLMLWLARAQFYRSAGLWTERFSPGWTANVFIVIGAATWIGFLANRQIPYADDLWWTFAANGHAPRMLRASLVVALVAIGLVSRSLLQPAQPEPELPSGEDLDRARPVISRSDAAIANVALAGDKHLLFADAGDAFLMYRIAGRSWIALGDPVGPPERREELIWRFRELVDEHAGRTVFYEVGGDSLPLYVDLGLTLIKLGEEAMVPLATFSLEGKARAELRTSLRRAEREGASFEIVEVPDVPALMPVLQAISDQWLDAKSTQEKGFSLGFFAPDYLANFPVALVRRQGVAVAFASLWTTGSRDELSVDLMRFGTDAPHGAMDFLFTRLMEWGRDQGYRYFSLGMAPLSGLEQHPLAPAWHRVGNLVFRYGEHFYNFEGLRRYKAKFLPEWRPKYLASPGGLALPRVLIDVSSLISGGLKGLVAKSSR